MLAVVVAVSVVIVAWGIIFNTGEGYPDLTAEPAVDPYGNMIIDVEAGSIPAGEWEIRIENICSGRSIETGFAQTMTHTSGDWYSVDNANLSPSSIVVFRDIGEGIYNISLRHGPTGHVYFVENLKITTGFDNTLKPC